MRLLFILICLLGSQLFSSAQSVTSFTNHTRIYIVRHAEKVTGKDAGRDPFLTTAGYKRAGDLMHELKKAGITRIYVSQYRRTQLTADSMRIQLGIDTVQYLADTVCDDLVNRIRMKGDIGGVILIVAHSNTIPFIIKKLGVTDITPIDISDNEYNNLFLVKKKRNKMVLIRKRYGQAPIGTAAPM